MAERGTVVWYGYREQEVSGYDLVIFDEIDNTYHVALHLLELGHHHIGYMFRECVIGRSRVS
jgi:DNA-binding LacI/PurR family transcriptional regulator